MVAAIEMGKERFNLFSQGRKLQEETRWREMADFVREQWRLDTDEQHRHYWISEYCAILKTDDKISPLETDLEFLKSVAKDKAIRVHHRVECAFTVGLLYHLAFDCQTGARYFRKAVELGQAITPQEGEFGIRTAIFEVDHDLFLERLPCRYRIKQVVAASLQNLGQYQTDQKLVWYPDTGVILEGGEQFKEFAEPGNSITLDDGRQIATPSKTTSRMYADTGDWKAFLPAGFHCDHCGLARAESQRNKLDVCEKCRRVYYCGTECQKQHWEAGHKEVCKLRGPGKEFLVGDVCQLQGLIKKPQFNGEVVRVAGRAECGERWAVAPMRGGDKISVQGKNLCLGASGTHARGAGCVQFKFGQD